MYYCSFTVTAQSQSGGRKVGDSAVRGGNFPPTNIVGLKTNRLMKFSVDLRPPTHCLLQPSTVADSCTCFPVHLDYDVTTVSSSGSIWYLLNIWQFVYFVYGLSKLSSPKRRGVSEQCLTSSPTQYRLYGRRFLQVKRPNQQYQSTEWESTKENNAASYDGEILHTGAWRPCAGHVMGLCL